MYNTAAKTAKIPFGTQTAIIGAKPTLVAATVVIFIKKI